MPASAAAATGAAALAARAADDLGQGWKVRPFLRVNAGETATLMDVEGSGIIQHIWMGTTIDWAGNGRACVLCFYWDGEETPSIKVPMTDFFAAMDAEHHRYALCVLRSRRPTFQTPS